MPVDVAEGIIGQRFIHALIDEISGLVHSGGTYSEASAMSERRRDRRWLKRGFGPDVSGRDRRADAGDSSSPRSGTRWRGAANGRAARWRRRDRRRSRPFGEAAIGGEDHDAFFLTGVDDLEEQIAAAENDRQIASSPSSISSARS